MVSQDSDGPGSIEHKRLAPDRFRRVWQLVEEIASSPGKSRKDFAREYALSERQIQADLNVIRTDMRLPLIRKRGYRFASEPDGSVPPFSLAEAQLLLMLLRRSVRDPALPGSPLRVLMQKLPSLFPPHLRPLVGKTLDATNGERGGGRKHEIFAALADALLQHSYVKLHYPLGEPSGSLQEPIVRPEVLVPYLDSWHLIGHCRQRGRVMVFDLDPVIAVTQASGI